MFPGWASGGSFKQLRELLRNKLVHHENKHYDGYRLTYLGYDYLAIKSLLAKGAIVAIGRQIGVGKEADIFEVVNEEGETLALKMHRLGRTSFRAVKNKRDYLKGRSVRFIIFFALLHWLTLSPATLEIHHRLMHLRILRCVVEGALVCGFVCVYESSNIYILYTT
jgi:RIO kinase 2